MISYVILLVCAVYGAWAYFDRRSKKKALASDAEIEAFAEKVINIAGRAALNAGSEATQQFHREHPDRCYIEGGRLFSPEYLAIMQAAQEATYTEIIGIALTCSDTRVAQAVRRSDFGIRSAVTIAAQQRHNDIDARLEVEAPIREAEKAQRAAYDAALAEARAGTKSEFASLREVSANLVTLLESITPAEFARRQRG